MRALLIVASGVCLLLSACRIPVTEHPLSDETNSRVDERLLGLWEVDLRPAHEINGSDGDESAIYLIERDEQRENTLLVRMMREGEKSSHALPAFTTHLGMHDYISFCNVGGKGSTAKAICRYELTDADQGKLYLMSGEFVAQQIEQSAIKGTFDRASNGTLQGIAIKDSVEAQRDFILRKGEAVFLLEKPMECRRVK